MCECGKLHVNKRLTIEQDPTRQGTNRKRGEKNISQRMNGAQAEIKTYLLAMPQTSVTVPDGNSLLMNRQVYTYELDPYRDVKPFIQAVIGKWFETGQPQKPPRWFFDAFTRPAYNAGAADTYSRVQMLAIQAGYEAAITGQLQLEQVLLGQPYQSRIEYVFQRSFNSMEKFSGDLGADLSRALADAMINGNSPRTLAGIMAEQFSIKHSRAMTIARTEINEAYRTAREEEAKDIRARLLPSLKVMHRSALLPTTRPWHADRHGKVYTIEEQSAWWSEGANKANCYCVSMEVLFDKKDKMYDAGLQEKLIKQRKTYFGLTE
jgi:hypothetical protein